MMNGPLKFLTALKILSLLDLLAKFKRVLAFNVRAPKIFAVARMLAFLSVFLEILWIVLWIKVNVILCGAWNSYKYVYQVQWKCTRSMTTISNKLANPAIYG